ncbi:MAG: hypothetical protein WCJ51_00020 [Candidatus Moraniibacteriota bacterium]
MYQERRIFGKSRIHESSYVSKHANIIGPIIVGKQVAIQSGARLRSDEDTKPDQGIILIGDYCNIQEGVVLHTHADSSFEYEGMMVAIKIGSGCCLVHKSMVHGPAIIGTNNLLMANSVVWCSNTGDNVVVRVGARLETCSVGNNCIIGCNAVVLSGVRIPDNKFVDHCTVVRTQEEADNLPEVYEEKIRGWIDKCDGIANQNLIILERYKSFERKMLKRHRYVPFGDFIVKRFVTRGKYYSFYEEF